MPEKKQVELAPAAEAPPIHVLEDKIILQEGTWNGDFFPAEEIKASLPALNNSRNRVGIFVGSLADHQDSTGTWVGLPFGFYWDDSIRGIRCERLEVVDPATVAKLKYQASKDAASWGVSPIIEIIVDAGNIVRDIKVVSIGLVLDPAQGEETMLSKEGSNTKKLVMLSFSERNAEMDEKQVKAIIAGELAELKEEREKLKAEIEKNQKENEKLYDELEGLKKKLADEKTEEEKSTTEAEAKAAEDKETADKEAAEKAEADKKAEEEKTAEEAKKAEEDAAKSKEDEELEKKIEERVKAGVEKEMEKLTASLEKQIEERKGKVKKGLSDEDKEKALANTSYDDRMDAALRGKFGEIEK